MRQDSTIAKPKCCSVCNAPFVCGDTDVSICWCNQYPALFDPNAEQDCLCPGCLHKATAKKIDHYVTNLTPKEALTDNKAKKLPKTNPLIPGIDYYIENGYWVFTAWNHLKRGTCCKSGCRHCPYP